MGKLCIIVLLGLFLISCKKEEAPGFTETSYKLTITGLWKSPGFTVPGSGHYTYFSGMVHRENTGLWLEGKLAAPGVEAIAETGNQFLLFAEVDSLIAEKTAIAQINIPPPLPDGTVTRTIYCNTNYPCISFASMIAPSPDWFIGISNLNLYRDNKWLVDTTIALHIYDAGTEEGDVFGYNNLPTTPPQTIRLLTPAKATVLANGNAALGAIASIRIQKQ